MNCYDNYMCCSLFISLHRRLKLYLSIMLMEFHQTVCKSINCLLTYHCIWCHYHLKGLTFFSSKVSVNLLKFVIIFNTLVIVTLFRHIVIDNLYQYWDFFVLHIWYIYMVYMYWNLQQLCCAIYIWRGTGRYLRDKFC